MKPIKVKISGSEFKLAGEADMVLQSTSLEIWDSKYRLKDNEGNPIDSSVYETNVRVARALADVEEEHVREYWFGEFLWALENGAIPAGRIMSTAGADEYKSAASTINCTVSGTIQDSMESILDNLREAGLTLSAGCGIGYCFSSLRPRGDFVNGVGASTSGPLSFMDVFDKMCFTISSAGGRRGAQMATFDVRHPDIEEFITAKREKGKLRQFNLSVLITDEFINAVKCDGDWDLIFPTKESTIGAAKTTYAYWPYACKDTYNVACDGTVLCKVHKTVKAKYLWDLIMKSTYEFAEPGFILFDEVNNMNNNYFCETITSTNPCGEQPLPPYGSCLLGSINLTKFVEKPFTNSTWFNWDKYKKVVKIFTRMLDNVVEINNLPLSEQRGEIYRKRRHGMGFTGLGSTLNLLGVKYGGEYSIEFTENAARYLAIIGWIEGVELAKEKGAAPIFTEDFLMNDEEYHPAKELFVNGKYMQKILAEIPGLQEEMLEHGCRFTHHSSIAPTGTISLALGNNVSNGIEPTFAHQYSRNIIVEGKKSKEKVEVFSYEKLVWDALPLKTKAPFEQIVTSVDDLTPKNHVDIQAAAQLWVDSSISKTINVPTECTFEEFRDIYLYACDKGLKGVTTFRYNPDVFQGVLVRDEDLKNTTYKFTLADGSVVEAQGNDQIDYDGELHTAANLYDALKEGYYGKY